MKEKLEHGTERVETKYAYDNVADWIGAGLDPEALAREVGGRIMGAFIRARKPA